MSPVNFDLDLLNEAIEHAPTAGFGPNVTYGKCTIEIKVVSWDRSSGKPVINEREYTGAPVKDGENLRIYFLVDVHELNPALTKEWKRNVDIKNSGIKSNGEKNEKALTDWEETVKPSLIKTLGTDWAKKLSKGTYVEIEEVDTVVLDKSGKPRTWTKKAVNEGEEDKIYTNTAPRFVHVFKSKAECQAAREERFGSKSSDESTEEEGSISKANIKDFQGLVASVGTAAEAMTLAEENNLFPNVNLKMLAVAAGYKLSE
jgi:hypothetical protein